MLYNNLDKYTKKVIENNFSQDEYTLYKQLEMYGLVSLDKFSSLTTLTLKQINSPVNITNNNDLYTIIDDSLYYVSSFTKGEVDYIDTVDLEMTFEELNMGGIIYTTPYQIESNLVDNNSSIARDSRIIMRLIISDAIAKKSANIHIETINFIDSIRHRIRFRINGILVEQDLPFTKHSDMYTVLREFIKTDLSSLTTDLSTNEGISTEASDIIEGTGIELRIAANEVSHGVNCVIRVQTPDTSNIGIEDLGFSYKVVESMKFNSYLRSGLVLFTGAKGTGKNTSACAFCRTLIDRQLKIQSYESPIEIVMPMVQKNYRDNIETLLKYIALAKKQDVDAVFINEIQETRVALALRDLVNSSIAAVTTFHIDRIWHLPYKLQEFYGNDFKAVLSQLRVVYNQKMFDKTCPHCRRSARASDLEDRAISKYLTQNGIENISFSIGCEHCNNKGKIGVQPLCEFVDFTPEVKDSLIRMESPYEMEIYIRQLVKENGTNMEVPFLDSIRNGDLALNGVYHFI